jgi:hypothetical protein
MQHGIVAGEGRADAQRQRREDMLSTSMRVPTETEKKRPESALVIRTFGGIPLGDTNCVSDGAGDAGGSVGERCALVAHETLRLCGRFRHTNAMPTAISHTTIATYSTRSAIPK